MWEWTVRDGVRNGPIRLSHLITSPSRAQSPTTTLLYYSYIYVYYYDIIFTYWYIGYINSGQRERTIREGAGDSLRTVILGLQMILSDLHPPRAPILFLMGLWRARERESATG